MDVDGVRVVHAMRGRLRLKVEALRANPTLAEAIHEGLGSLRGIRSVETNPRTGSVLVLYDAERLASEESLQELTEALEPIFPGLAGVQLPALVAGRLTNGSPQGVRLDRKITSLFGSVNTGIERATGGIDLRVLVPVALFLLGVRSLLVTDRVRFPTWYDFIWFSFGTFLALNPLGAPRAEATAA